MQLIEDAIEVWTKSFIIDFYLCFEFFELTIAFRTVLLNLLLSLLFGLFQTTLFACDPIT